MYVCIRAWALIRFMRKNRMFKTKLEEEIICLKELCTHIDRHKRNSDEDHCFCNAILHMRAVKGALSRYFSVIIQCRIMFLHQRKPKNNDAVLLSRSLSLHRNHSLPPSA